MASHHCHACGHEITMEVKVGRRDTCDNCGNDLHCCMNCRFYDKRGDRCREDIAHWVKSRDRSNFCTQFEYVKTEADAKDELAEAKAKLSALFKNL